MSTPDGRPYHPTAGGDERKHSEVSRSAPIIIDVTAVFKHTVELDPDQFDVPISEILASMASSPDDWLTGEVIDNGECEVTFVVRARESFEEKPDV